MVWHRNTLEGADMDEPNISQRCEQFADPLLTPREAAAEVGIGLSTLWRDLRANNFLAPYRVTPRTLRWRQSELRAWVATRRSKFAARAKATPDSEAKPSLPL